MPAPANKWTERLVEAVLADDGDPVIRERLDVLIRWLAGVKGPDTAAITLEFEKRDTGEQQARQLALVALDPILFRDGNDPWYTLGLTPGAAPDAIKQRYYRLTKIYHPDRQLSDEEWLNDRAEKINTAYQQAGRGKPAPSRPAPPPASRPMSGYSAPGSSISIDREEGQPTFGDWLRSALGDPRNVQRNLAIAGIVLAVIVVALFAIQEEQPYIPHTTKKDQPVNAAAAREVESRIALHPVPRVEATPPPSSAESTAVVAIRDAAESRPPAAAPSAEATGIALSTPTQLAPATNETAGSRPVGTLPPQPIEPQTMTPSSESTRAELSASTEPAPPTNEAAELPTSDRPGPESTAPPAAAPSAEATRIALSASTEPAPQTNEAAELPTSDKPRPEPTEPTIAAPRAQEIQVALSAPTQSVPPTPETVEPRPAATPRPRPAESPAAASAVQASQQPRKSTAEQPPEDPAARLRKKARFFLTRYANLYTDGDAAALAGLYEENALQQNLEGRERIHDYYTRFFRVTESRELYFDLDRVEDDAEGYRIHTRYSGRLNYRGGGSESISGTMSFQVSRRGTDLAIREAAY